MNKKILIIVCVIIVCIVLWMCFLYPQGIMSASGNNITIVDEYPEPEKALVLLDSLIEDAKRLVAHTYKKYPNDDGIIRLKNKFDPNAMKEGKPDTHEFTFTEDKGKSMTVCIRNKNMKFHDKNLILFPLIHELAHIADKDYNPDHGGDFKKYFKLLLKEAIEIGLYKPIDFQTEPTEYCNTTITSSPI